MAEEKNEDLVHLTIDDIPVEVPRGTLVWAAAKEAGIEVPVYCYHPKMDPLGACRMCFVEIEKLPKPPQTACTTPVAEGMVVHTKTEMVLKARRGTLEFLLVNHPLDCPICDKAGECDLQDFTLRHGPGGTRFDLEKRHYQKPIPMSEDIFLDRERCILCQRCTRFSSEIAMDNGLVMISRGFRMEVGTAPDRSFDTNFSGNTVEICPVGALTAKSYRFKARPWELKRTPGICTNCSVGCNARIDSRVDKILRLMSRNNDEIDDGWLCNRGRWEFSEVNSDRRLRTPFIRRNGQLEPASWDEALNYIREKLQGIIQHHGSRAVAGIGSTHTTNEEAYLFQKLLREVIKTPHVDHYHGNFAGPRDVLTGQPWRMTNSITEIEKAAHIVLVAADPYQRQPILDLRIKKAWKKGAKIFQLNAVTTELERFTASQVTVPEGMEGAAVKVILKHLLKNNKLDLDGREEIRSRIQHADQAVLAAEDHFGAKLTTRLYAFADEIIAAENVIFLYDEMATLASDSQDLATDLQSLAVATNNIGRPGAGVGPLFSQANSLGARDMGLLPDALPGYLPATEQGLTYSQMLNDPSIKALFVMGANPAMHLADGKLSSDLELVVVQDLLPTETVLQADVVLPAVSFAEKEGSMTNLDQHVQAIRPALRPLPGARADWAILVDLARYLGASWNYADAREVLLEIAETNPYYAGLTWEDLGLQGVRLIQASEVAHV